MGRRDLYKILQVDPEAEPEVIQAAFRRLARKYHPDVAGDAAAADAAAARMIEINEAWAVLGDAHRRAAYDADRTAAGSSGGEGRRDAARGRGAAPPHGGFGSRAARSDTGGWSRGATPGTGSASGDSPAAGSAGPPPGSPAGSVLNFGRYAGWSLGEIARHDPDFLEQLDRLPIGRRYRDEVDQILRRLGRRGSVGGAAGDPGPFRRR